MHITRVEIENVPQLGDVEFDCDERVNLFIGPNGSGKSTILKAINRVQSSSSDIETDGRMNVSDIRDLGGVPIRWGDVYVWLSDDWPQKVRESEDIPGRYACVSDEVPVLFIPSTRIDLWGHDIFKELTDWAISHPKLLSEGFSYEDLNELRDQYFKARPTSDLLRDIFAPEKKIFYGNSVALAISRIWAEIVSAGSERTLFQGAIEIGYSCARSICPEVLRGDTAYSHFEPYFDDNTGEAREAGFYAMGVLTNKPREDVPPEYDTMYLGNLSLGTQGTLLWIWALVLKMAHYYNWAEGWQEKPAILLIDEIENHLHPTWQRRVIPALLKHFPGLQIFATTHSPFAVAGLKAGQVHLLKRDPETGSVTASTYTEDIIGWTADEILRTMLDVDDPTDEETAKNAQKLRKLRKEGPRDTPEKEEERQQAMEKLRRLVDRDLLAGGPMAAQMELFEQQFAEALAQYRQSQSLNQENG